MSTEENKDTEIPPFPKPKEGYVSPVEEVKEEKKQSTGGSIISILVSLFFIVRGVMWIGDGMETWGYILIILGIGGGIWKIYDMMKE